MYAAKWLPLDDTLERFEVKRKLAAGQPKHGIEAA